MTSLYFIFVINMRLYNMCYVISTYCIKYDYYYYSYMFSLKWVLMGFITIVSDGMLFLPYILSFIGLSSIGPIAGGLFSTFQCAGIVSGSAMAMTQSFAMSGWTKRYLNNDCINT